MVRLSAEVRFCAAQGVRLLRPRCVRRFSASVNDSPADSFVVSACSIIGLWRQHAKSEHRKGYNQGCNRLSELLQGEPLGAQVDSLLLLPSSCLPPPPAFVQAHMMLRPHASLYPSFVARVFAIVS